ncbi:hypothetical protein MRX96_011414 [Rhipicephalus microplus]
MRERLLSSSRTKLWKIPRTVGAGQVRVRAMASLVFINAIRHSPEESFDVAATLRYMPEITTLDMDRHYTANRTLAMCACWDLWPFVGDTWKLPAPRHRGPG